MIIIISLNGSVNSRRCKLVTLTCIKLLLDLAPLPNIIYGNDGGNKEEEATGNDSKSEKDQLPIPQENLLIFSWRGCFRLLLERVYSVMTICSHRLAPINFNWIYGSTHGVEVFLTRPYNNLMSITFRARHTLVNFHIPIFVVFARHTSRG